MDSSLLQAPPSMGFSRQEYWSGLPFPSTVSQRVGPDRRDPADINTRLFFLACGNSAPVRVEREGGTTAWLVGIQVVPSVQGHGLPPWQELWPYQSLFSSLL